MNLPKRAQRKRTKGWQMPENSKYVGRPTKFGNPFPPETLFGDVPYALLKAANIPFPHMGREIGLDTSLVLYRVWLQVQLANSTISWEEWESLRQYDYLLCWCPLDQACHVDVIIELAERTEQ